MKIVTFLAFVIISFSASAQLDLKKATNVASALGFDPAKTEKSVMDQLTPKLGLTGDQVTKVSSSVKSFLQNKSTYITEAQTKPADYKTKLEAGQKTLMDGVKAAVTPAQFTTFLGLKPATADKANALAQLFY